MPITYTNRKGRTYYLCEGITKTGKPRYYFAREQKGEPVEEIPSGFKISESVNGIVSLAKDRPAKISLEEVAVMEKEVRRHPKSRNYRVGVKHDRIEIYELAGPDGDWLLAAFKGLGFLTTDLADQMQAELSQYGQFTPVMRFILADEERRTFRPERMCYLGSVDDWIGIGSQGTVHQLARQYIPKLGTDAFFNLY